MAAAMGRSSPSLASHSPPVVRTAEWHNPSPAAERSKGLQVAASVKKALPVLPQCELARCQKFMVNKPSKPKYQPSIAVDALTIREPAVFCPSSESLLFLPERTTIGTSVSQLRTSARVEISGLQYDYQDTIPSVPSGLGRIILESLQGAFAVGLNECRPS